MHSTSSLEGMLIIFLAAAVYTDLRDHRIPNMIALSAALVGVCAHLYLAGLDGAGFALGGLAVGMGLLLPFYALGGMGAGDVKLMAGIGAFLGPQQTLLAVGLTLVFGAVGALGLLLIGCGRQRLSSLEATNIEGDCLPATLSI
jgi:prepilin peptidase CpaA